MLPPQIADKVLANLPSHYTKVFKTANRLKLGD
jgi:hypothetical protein